MTYFGCFFLLYLFQGLIIYLIGSRVVLLETGFPPCVVKYDMFQWLNVSVNLFYAWTSKSLSVVLRRESHTIALTSSWLWEVSMLALYRTWVLYLPLSRGTDPHISPYGQSNPYFGLLHIPVYKLTRWGDTRTLKLFHKRTVFKIINYFTPIMRT